MKKIFLIFVASVCAISAHSQDWETNYVSGEKGINQTYLTNKWFDNLFVGASAGISTKFTVGRNSDISKIQINPSVNVYVMKWFTPRIGARFGYSGFNGREGLNAYFPYLINHTPFPYQEYGANNFVDSSGKPGVLHYGSTFFHADLLWNLTNFFSGYEVGRFYTISAYVSGGGLILYDNKTKGNRGIGSSCKDHEFVLGAGLLNTFRITDRILATADLRYSNHASRYRTATGVRTNWPSLTVGIAYNVYKTNWTNSTVVKTTLDEARAATRAAEQKTAEVQAAYDDLELDLEELKLEFDKLRVEDSKNIKVDRIEYNDLKARAEKADLVVYFYINDYVLNFSEQYHLTEYVKDCLAKDPEHVFHITGSADKGTGNDTINQTLSRNRALYVKSILIKQFGVKEENITVENVVTDRHLDGAYDRCAILER